MLNEVRIIGKVVHDIGTPEGSKSHRITVSLYTGKTADGKANYGLFTTFVAQDKLKNIKINKGDRLLISGHLNPYTKEVDGKKVTQLLIMGDRVVNLSYTKSKDETPDTDNDLF